MSAISRKIGTSENETFGRTSPESPLAEAFAVEDEPTVPSLDPHEAREQRAGASTRVLLDFAQKSPEQMRAVVEARFTNLVSRRSVREFSDAPIDLEVVRRCIDVAAQAPSGAHKQPWTFALVHDAETKRRIREAAEEEERAFYRSRAPQRWLDDLAFIGTDAEKPFLETAPALIAVFAQRTGPAGERHYYVQESVGIAVGFLISALHESGLVTLTHTPSPMNFLSEVLERPENERAFLLLPVGLPAPGCTVPALERKTRDQYLVEK